MNLLDKRDALRTLRNTVGWTLLLSLIEEDRQRLLANMANTKPNAEGALDIAFAQGQINILDNLDNFVAITVQSMTAELEQTEE